MRKGIRGTTILILLVLMGAFLFAQPQTKSPTDQELIDNGFKKLGGGNLAGAVGDFTKAIQPPSSMGGLPTQGFHQDGER